jgi:hypothetical protein
MAPGGGQTPKAHQTTPDALQGLSLPFGTGQNGLQLLAESLVLRPDTTPWFLDNRTVIPHAN